MDPSNPIVAVITEITEPILAPLRQFIPRIGMIDLSPMIAIFLLFAIARAAGELSNGTFLSIFVR